ncbi:unnamed protein product [Diatraea saccharalis]|uniref:Fucosyltransferase n=1 Tax=Diatraea saccharalis TaxID=40085 RepID=A0A9N9QT06_9NEOP|nr:unnamed protein product [Diatraea saccharalis]
MENAGQATFLKHKCHHSNCYLTSNRSLLGNLGYFDTILFSAQEISSGERNLPNVRAAIQKYVFVANDSADNYPVCDSFYDQFFNWTWTYKMESSIPYTFFTVHNIHDENLGSHFRWILNMTPIDTYMKSQLSSKRKAVAIFLDKCKSRSKREVYIENLKWQLSKYNLGIDVYGNCGKNKCKKKMSGCFWRLKKYYFFYLAMEDSISPNYITQEVVYGYENNAVPVVYGGAQYSKFLPPNSYLNAMQLNEEMLARAMNDIIRNRSLYYDYFRWKNHYIIKATKTLDPCALCKALNNKNWLTFRTRNVNFRKWWNAFYKTRCAESSIWRTYN